MGWTYNTRDPDAPTTGPLITGVASALTILSLITICLRTYVRAFLIRAFGVDDWIILVTWFCAAGFAIITIVQTKWGLGLQHIQDLPTEDVYNFGLLQYMGAPFYITSILGFKLALLFSYLRFVPIGVYRYTIFSIITACIMFHLSFLLVQINLCQPARKQWDPTITWGSCIPGVPFYTSMASITIVFDVTVMLLPFPVLVKSRIQTRKKLILLGLFGLGLFITVIQIIRIQTVKQLSNYIDSAPLILWSAVENNLGIIVANVPTLAPLVKYYNERSSRGASSNTRPTYANGTGGGGGGTGGRGGNGLYGPGSRNRGGGNAGSKYASGTWKSQRSKGGLETLTGSVHEADGTEMDSYGGTMVSCGKGNGSTDSILDSCETYGTDRDRDRDRERDGEGEGSASGSTSERGAPANGITKKVEVVITRS